MAFFPMASLPPQFSNPTNGENAEGFFLEAYIAGTTTRTNFYSDAAGTSVGHTITLDAGGFTSTSPETPGNVFVPFLDDSISYKFILTDPDTLIKFTVDNITDAVSSQAVSNIGKTSNYVFSNVSDMASRETVGGVTIVPVLGYQLATLGRTTANDSGNASYIVTNDTANGYDKIDLGGGFTATLIEGNKIFAAKYGATGNGTDDDYAVLNHIFTNAGSKLIVLDENSVYRHTSVFSISPTTDLNIDGKGSKLLLDTASVVENGVLVTVDGYDVNIKNIFFDADSNAHRCIRIINDTNSTLKDCNLVDVRCENAYRASTDFQGGDGIQVRGGYNRLNIIRPVIKNILMADGAGVEGSEGVFGITVTRDFANTLGAKYVTITDPYIENVKSEVDTYYYDQDGIRLLGLESSATGLSMDEGAAKITGGTFVNCWGRGIKVQRNDTLVANCSFTRTTGFDTGYGNTEIDFQFGSGRVSNIQCYYDGFNPTTIVNSSSGEHRQTGFSVDGIHALVENTTLDCAVQRFRSASPPATNYQSTPLFASNISIEGDTVNMIRYDVDVGTAADPGEYCVVQNCYATDITGVFLRLRGHSGETVKVIIKNVADRSNTGTPLLSESSAVADLCAENVLGMGGEGDTKGSWTANLKFGGANTGISYSTRLGFYNRTNGVANGTLYLLLANKGSSTGTATIDGLPHTIANDSEAYPAVSIANMRNITFTGQMNAWGEINTDRINLGQTTEAGAYSALTDANFSNNSEIILSFSYRTEER